MAYSAQATLKLLWEVIKLPFMPYVVIVKLLRYFDDYIDKRHKMGEYLQAEDAGSARQMNAMRVAEAEKIVDAIEKMTRNTDKDDKQVKMDPDLRDQMLKYLTDEKRDMDSIIDTAKDLEKQAKRKKSLEAQYGTYTDQDISYYL